MPISTIFLIISSFAFTVTATGYIDFGASLTRVSAFSKLIFLGDFFKKTKPYQSALYFSATLICSKRAYATNFYI